MGSPDAINIKSISDSRSPSNILNGNANKPILVAYNRPEDFKVFLDNELDMIGNQNTRNKTNPTNNPSKQNPDPTHTDLTGYEPQNVAINNNVKGYAKKYGYHPKIAVKNFNPLPRGSRQPDGPRPDEDIKDKLIIKEYKPISDTASKDMHINNKPGFKVQGSGFKVDNTVDNKDKLIAKGDKLDSKEQVVSSEEDGFAQQLVKYKEDQLLTNPGGDNFFIDRDTGIIDYEYDHSNFVKRVGKDMNDAWANIKNSVKDLGFGSEIKYIDSDGEIKSHKKVGFLKTIGNFFKNIASGITFGAYTPENEAAPAGTWSRLKHFVNKVFVQAIGKDLFKGVAQSMLNVGEDIAFAGLNLIETVPDATIGNTKAGRVATTKIFDNLQVGLDFATDIMPGGEGSSRARTLLVNGIKKGLPFLNGNKDPEKTKEEQPELYARSTPFRKVIETLSFFIPFRF